MAVPHKRKQTKKKVRKMVTELEKKVMQSANLNHVSKTWFSGPYKFESRGCEIEVTARGEGVINEWSVAPICYGLTGIEVKVFDDDEYSTVWLDRNGEAEWSSDFDHMELTEEEKRREEAWNEIMYREDFEKVVSKLVRWFGIDRLLYDNLVSSENEWHSEPVRFFSDNCKAEYTIAAFGKLDDDVMLDEIEVMVLTHHANTAVLFDADGNMKSGDFKPEKNVIRVLEGGGCETYPADGEDMEELNMAVNELRHGDDFEVSVMRNYITFVCSVYGTYGKG